MKKPQLLLHACCSPCFTSVFEQLKDEFEVTVFWFNPNIYPQEEYAKRYIELERYAKIVDVKVVNVENYQAESLSWNQLTKNFPLEEEGGQRCKLCIKYRLLNTAKFARDNNYDCFATTLTVSPHKNAEIINQIGDSIANGLDLNYLARDFKKQNGYKRSIEICKEFNIYRQNYCGCQYSKR